MTPGGSSVAASAEDGSSKTSSHVSADLVNGSIGTFRMYFSWTRTSSDSG